MTWTSKRIFKVTPGSRATWIMPLVISEPTPAAEEVSPAVVEDLQGQIDDIIDSLENNYAVGFVFDQFDYFISTHPFYFHWEVPLGTVEIVSARVSFEVKDYRNESLTDSRYAITGDSTDRPVIKFSVSEDKGHLFRDIYGPYETDMRAIDISGDLTGEGIKVIKFETDNDVCVTARVFLRVKIDKDKTPESILGDGSIGGLSERPEVRTLAATSILDVSATLNGDIISVGKGSYTDRTTGEIVPVTCTKRGFKYGLTKTNTWDTNEEGNFVKGTYSLGVTGLTPETDYYFRAYAENQVGRNYGEYMKLTTLVAHPFVAVSTGGTLNRVMTSPDGITWTSRVTNNNNWRSICWSRELDLFCAVASYGTGNTRVMTSPDGITWTLQTAASNNDWYGVCWSPELELFCAVSNTGTSDCVMTSPDGITWTSRVTTNTGWQSVCWSPELTLFCAAAYTNNRVMTSPDGITWTDRTAAADNRWRSICWSPELTLFCAVSSSGSTNRVMTSPDGTNWTTRVSNDDNWRGICWSPELTLFCAVSSSGTVMTSPDGITWTLQTAASNNGWYSICWSAGLTLFCAVSFSGTNNRVMTSPDGITWTSRVSAADNSWYGVI